MKQVLNNDFVTDDAGIAALARAMLDASRQITVGRVSYIRSLLAITQESLGVQIRATQAKTLRVIEDEEKERQLTALKAAHDRCWSVIEPVLEDALAGEPRDELHKRAVYVRTALSTLRSAVRAGVSLLELAPRTVTKESVRKIVDERRGVGDTDTPGAARSVLSRYVASTIRAARELAAEDTLTASTALNNAIDDLMGLALELGLTKAVRTPAQAIKQHRPVHMEGGVFWPVAMQ